MHPLLRTLHEAYHFWGCTVLNIIFLLQVRLFWKKHLVQEDIGKVMSYKNSGKEQKKFKI